MTQLLIRVDATHAVLSTVLSTVLYFDPSESYKGDDTER